MKAMGHRRPGAVILLLASGVLNPLHGTDFTGPLLTPSPGAPQGFLNLEPYLVYSQSHGNYSGSGKFSRQSNPGTWINQNFITYGLTPQLSIMASVAVVKSGVDSSDPGNLRPGDSTLRLNYIFLNDSRLNLKWNIYLEHQFATGKYDQLGSNSYNGVGEGWASNTFGTLIQKSFEISARHTLRLRYDLSYSGLGGHIGLHGANVYLNERWFNGYYKHGNVYTSGLAAEFNLTGKLALAIDTIYSVTAAGRLVGAHGSGIDRDDGIARSVTVAPAVEYNFSPACGLIFGYALVPAGERTADVSHTAMAVNLVW